MAATMATTVVPSSAMNPYPSVASNVQGIEYNQSDVIYNQPNFTYEFTTYRGNALPRFRRGVVMESK